VSSVLVDPSAPPFARINGQLRNHPKLDLWIAWYVMVVFYLLFGVVFVLMTKVMPPPGPDWSTERIVRWFAETRSGLLNGFAIIFAVTGMAALCNAIISYSMWRMSVSKAFAYAYLIIYSLAAIPGMLFCAILLTVGALRPERDPKLIVWLYEAALLTFVGTMGIFLLGTLVWLIAVLLDKNRVLPAWFGFLNICNLLTEVVVAPAWTSRRGAFAWNGSIAFWVDTLVFVIYTCAFILVLRKMIERENFGTGPLPITAHEVLPEKLAGAWSFILIECGTFSAYFIVYMLYRMHDPATFGASQLKLNAGFGVANTLILLASSWQVARSVHSARAGHLAVAWRQALSTVLLGAAFVVSKLSEWYLGLRSGYSFATNDFFAFYFFLTGIHVVHVLLGFIFMGVGMQRLRAADASHQALEIAAIYWHMVDFLWVVIFALLYVMR
jgi:heme/copper-type cytochrome/quinol oxidase subunit 3